MDIIEYPEYLPYKNKSDFLEYLTKYITLQQLEFIDKIIIVSKEEYGNAIRQIDDTETYTENSSNVGIAKTIGRVIIIHDYIIELLLGDYQGVEECHFTIFHEFGHIKDNIIRVSKSYQLSRPFRIENVTRYYSNIILDEIAANSFAAKYIDNSIFKSLNEKKYIDLQDSMDRLSKYKNPLSENGKFELSGEIWIIIYKLLEIYALAYHLKKIKNVRLPKLLKNIVTIQHMKDLNSNYPEWNEREMKILEELWWEIILRNKLDNYLI